MTTPTPFTRRQLVKAICAAACFSDAVAKPQLKNTPCVAPPASNAAWNQAKVLRSYIVEPSFNDREFVITEFGAIADAKTVNSEAINEAIDQCNKAGGGRVVVPAGTFLTGALVLKSNVNLHLADNAELRFSQKTEDYLPLTQTWFEGVELINYRPQISAFKAHNVAITGNGLLNGAATFDGWWSWRGPRSWKGAKSGTSTGWQPGMPHQKPSRNKLMQMAAENVPVAQRVFGEGHYLRTSMIEFNRCSKVLLEGVTIKDAPFWSVHPVLSNNVIARGVTIDNPVGANADGIDPECCENVLIENCRFDNGDDCISLKSGRNHDGRRIDTPCRNVFVSKCHFSSERSAISCGSEATGGVHNVFIEDCQADHIFRLFRIKTNTKRGGVIKDIYLKNFKVQQALENLIEIQTNFSEPLKDDPLEQSKQALHIPEIRNIHLQQIDCVTAYRALNLLGSEYTPIQGLTLDCINVHKSTHSNVINYLENGESRNSFINGDELNFNTADT